MYHITPARRLAFFAAIAFLTFGFISLQKVNAQTTISSSYTNYYYWPSSSSGITFVVNNTNSSPILISAVGYSSYSTSCTSAELWYSSTSLSGNTGVINSSNSAWTLLKSVNSVTPSYPTIVNNFFSGLSLIVPGNTQYRFAVITNINVLFGGPPSSFTPTVYSSNGVDLNVGGSLFGDPASGGLLYSGYGYYGSITFDFACASVPSGLNVTGITSSTATASWTAVSGSAGYEYTTTQTTTPPTGPGTATLGTSAPLTGLIPATNYYLWVRNKCASGYFSAWVSFPFTTLPPCKPPVGFNVTNLLPTSATINWNAWPSALDYDYVVDQSNQDPTTSTGITNTLLTTAPATPLNENTWYFVHIRSNCAGNEQSLWSLDSFLTPIPCRPPNITISNINTDEAVAYWNAVPTALYYEYAITTSSTPPAQGTKYNYTSLHTSALSDGKDYYVHVRSHCNSIGILGTSDWATASFKTFPTGVPNVNDKEFSVETYPNPVKDILTVQIKGMRSGQAQLRLSDISGKIIQLANVILDKTELNMAGLPSGTYRLQYADESRSEIIKLSKY